MPENIEFIPASSLPEAEGDEVSVLCLENGEMKQKPANGLGGGYDAVILIHDNHDSDGNYTDSTFTIEKGTYADVLAKIKANELVKVALHGVNFTYGADVAFCIDSAHVSEYAFVDPADDGTRPLSIAYMGGDGYDWSIYWHTNDIVSYNANQTAVAALSLDTSHAPGRN